MDFEKNKRKSWLHRSMYKWAHRIHPGEHKCASHHNHQNDANVARFIAPETPERVGKQGYKGSNRHETANLQFGHTNLLQIQLQESGEDEMAPYMKKLYSFRETNEGLPLEGAGLSN